MVLQDLLHGVGQHRHGDPRGTAGLPRLHLLHGYPHLRPLRDRYYWRSQEEFKVKYIKARIAEVTSDGERLIVKGEDTLVKRPITIPFDMVVHAIGMDPNVDNCTCWRDVFGVDLEPHGLHRSQASTYQAIGADVASRGFRRRRRDGPETIDDSIAQGQAAAMAALRGAQGNAAVRRRVEQDVLLRRIPETIAKPATVARKPRCWTSAGPAACARLGDAGSQAAKSAGGMERYVDCPRNLKSRVPGCAGAGTASMRLDRSRSDVSGCARSWRPCAGALRGLVSRPAIGFHGSRKSCPLRRCSTARRTATSTDARVRPSVAGVSRRPKAPLGARPRRRGAAQSRPGALSADEPLGVGRKANTGVLREIWHGDDVDHMTIPVPDAYDDLSGAARGAQPIPDGQRRSFATCWYVDLLCAQIYAEYICAQGGSYPAH